MIDVKKILESGALVGPRACTRKLRSGTAQRVYLSSNCPAASEIERIARLCGVAVERLDMTSQELGAQCKRHFSVSVLCV